MNVFERCKRCKTNKCCDRGGFCYVDAFVLKRLIMQNEKLKHRLLKEKMIDENGKPIKPLFKHKHGCLIYEHRPPACRVYFCEVWNKVPLTTIAKRFSKKLSVNEFINYMKRELEFGVKYAHSGGYLCFVSNLEEVLNAMKQHFDFEIIKIGEDSNKELRVIIDSLNVHNALRLIDIIKPQIYGKDYCYIVFTTQTIEDVFSNECMKDLLAMKLFVIN